MGLFGRRPRLSDEQRAQLRQTAREWIVPGFRSRSGMAEELVEIHDDIEAPGDVLLAAAREVVDEVWRDRLVEESTWADTGDFGRLERAYAALSHQGLVCRMDFTCCNTCGTDEIDDERTPRAAPEGEYPYEEWAYTFFHQQDSELLTEPGAVLFLTYSAFRAAPGIDAELAARSRAGDEEARREVVRFTETTVGTMVRDALVAEGLTVEWSGDSSQRVAVRVAEWRKPLPRS
jgi:hypothetical protein